MCILIFTGLQRKSYVPQMTFLEFWLSYKVTNMYIGPMTGEYKCMKYKISIVFFPLSEGPLDQ